MDDKQKTKKARTGTIYAFFQRHDASTSRVENEIVPPLLEAEIAHTTHDCDPTSVAIEVEILERDPGKQKPIYEYDVNQRDVMRRVYIQKGAFQPELKAYPLSEDGRQKYRFQMSWFKRVGNVSMVDNVVH